MLEPEKYTHTLTSEQLEKGCNEGFDRDLEMLKKIFNEGGYYIIFQDGDKFETIFIPPCE